MNRSRLIVVAACVAACSLMLVACQPNNVQSGSANPSARGIGGEYQAAIADYTETINADPNDAKAYYSRGFVYSLMRQPDKAVADYTRAIEITPDNADAYNNRGAAHYQMEQYAEAVADYDKALELKPNYGLVHGNRAMAYYYLRQFDKARADLALCEQNGGRPDAFLVKCLAKLPSTTKPAASGE